MQLRCFGQSFALLFIQRKTKKYQQKGPGGRVVMSGCFPVFCGIQNDDSADRSLAGALAGAGPGTAAHTGQGARAAAVAVAEARHLFTNTNRTLSAPPSPGEPPPDRLVNAGDPENLPTLTSWTMAGSPTNSWAGP